MWSYTRSVILFAAAAAVLTQACLAQGLSPALRAKVDAKAEQLKAWGTDPAVIAAVRSANTSPPAELKGMTNERWSNLTVLDPLVRGMSGNPLAQHLKSKREPAFAECFVSSAAGTKVAFYSKPTFWSHGDKDKHKVPMTGKTWIGPEEVDKSSGVLSVQVAVPVLDGAKPIGSIVIGLDVGKL
jgi:hypothetical protein